MLVIIQAPTLDSLDPNSAFLLYLPQVWDPGSQVDFCWILPGGLQDKVSVRQGTAACGVSVISGFTAAAYSRKDRCCKSVTIAQRRRTSHNCVAILPKTGIGHLIQKLQNYVNNTEQYFLWGLLKYKEKAHLGLQAIWCKEGFRLPSWKS